MLAGHVGCGIVIGQVEVREDLARKAAPAYIERVFEDASFPEHAIRPQHLNLTRGPACQRCPAPPAEMGLALVGRAAHHANALEGLAGFLGILALAGLSGRRWVGYSS